MATSTYFAPKWLMARYVAERHDIEQRYVRQVPEDFKVTPGTRGPKLTREK